MTTSAIIRAALATLLLVPAACNSVFKKDDADKPKGPAPVETPAPEDNDGFSLSIPRDQWQASKFCGDVMPPIPENPTPPHRFDHAFLNGKLGSDGLTGWVHGAVPQYQQYLFTYRLEDATDPMRFFKAEQYSLIPGNAEVAAILPTLKRHDKIRLKGTVFDNGSPLTHLKVTSVEMLEKYPRSTDNSYGFDVAQLKGQSTFQVFGQVHVMINSDQYGRAMVIEHKDFVMPIAVPPKHDIAASKLYRGDIVNVSVKMMEAPNRPPHFVLDEGVEQAIDVIDPMLHCHNAETTVTGYLTKFDKSPAISLDTYAIRVVDANGIGRNFTLFTDLSTEAGAELFFALRDKAAAAWDASPEAPTVVRNFWKKESIKVTAKGRLNVVSSEQANAQVYMTAVEDLKVVSGAP